MGKTSKWIRNFLTGKKPKDKGGDISNDDSSISAEIPKTPLAVPPNTPKEKRRWSFRRSGSGNNNVRRMDSMAITPNIMPQPVLESQKAKTAPKATASDIRLSSASRRRSSALQDVAAIMIQAVFRSYLARRALCALKGLVKLQALVRGHLVRKQAISTLRSMQALVNVQVRTRAQRLQRSSTYNMDKHLEDSIKDMQMDLSEPRGSTRRRNSYSPALPDTSPSPKYFDEYSISTEQSSLNCCSTVCKQDLVRVSCYSPQLYAKTFYRNYMANTESFKAKARSQSAPKQRLDLLERQTSRKKVSTEGRNVLGIIRMQRSSTHVGLGSQRHQFPWLNKLDSSAVSPVVSETDSTNGVITHTSYCRTLDAYEASHY